MGDNELFAYSRAKLFDILDDGENVDEQVYFRFSSSFIKTFPIIHDEITEKNDVKEHTTYKYWWTTVEEYWWQREKSDEK